MIGAGAVHALGPLLDARTSTCRRRSARSGPTARRRSCRAAGCAATSASSTAKKSTPLEPVLSLRRSDVSPLPSDRFVEVTIPLYYEGHAYRAGLADPGDDLRAERRPADLGVREAQPKGHATVAIAYSKRMPSRLTLPVVPGVSVPTGLPPCPGLRGEPCRAYQPLPNRG